MERLVWKGWHNELRILSREAATKSRVELNAESVGQCAGHGGDDGSLKRHSF